MSNQALAKRRREEVAAGSMDNDHEDRISELPQTILHHHILSLLPQKDAIRTCVLSKSWRHLGPTRPKFEFNESYFPDRSKKQEFLSVLENTLQRYHDQKLPIHELILRIVSKISISLINKWIPLVLMNMGLKIFSLSALLFSPPALVFQAKFLEELYLEGCDLNQINNNCINVNLQVLKCLSLKYVYIKEETFEKILSGCPLIQRLVLGSCCWSGSSSNIKVKKARNLKHFILYDLRVYARIDSIEIDDATSLETIRITRCRYWLSHPYFFPRLKSLHLHGVYLTTELFFNLSSNFCPCLQELELQYCSIERFDEFKLSNRSIKRLTIIDAYFRPIKAVVDAANMLCFEFKGSCYPSISFAATSREWESKIEVWRVSDQDRDDVFSTWLLKLYQFLKTLSQSQISLDISHFPFTNHQDTKYEDGGCEPVVIEHLFLGLQYPCCELPTLLNLNWLFRTCRPRYIGLSLSTKSQRRKSQLAESIWNTLVNKGETWQQDLEESSIQVSDKKTNEYWHPVQVCAFSDDQNIRFRLKWRNLS